MVQLFSKTNVLLSLFASIASKNVYSVGREMAKRSAIFVIETPNSLSSNISAR